MSRRWREPTAKPGELKAAFGKERFSDRPDLLYVWGGKGASKPDARVLSYALEDALVFDGKPLRQVLVERGYDITTLRLSVSRATPTDLPPLQDTGERDG